VLYLLKRWRQATGKKTSFSWYEIYS